MVNGWAGLWRRLCVIVTAVEICGGGFVEGCGASCRGTEGRRERWRGLGCRRHCRICRCSSLFFGGGGSL